MKSAHEHPASPVRSLRNTYANANSELLGARLRRLRQQQGLSLRALAGKVGVTATALHMWESGRRNPKHEHLQAFADAFRLTRTELILGTDASGQARESFAGPATRTSDQASDLAAVIASCKERIAATAGTSAERVRIVIEV